MSLRPSSGINLLTSSRTGPGEKVKRVQRLTNML